MRKYGVREADFGGAFFTGSTVRLADDDELPVASDVDIAVVVDREAPMKLGKFRYHGVLLEVFYLSWSQLASAEQVLSSFHLAGGLRHDTIIADPTGRLRSLHQQVARGFSRRLWVRRRCEDAGRVAKKWLQAIDASTPFPEQVTSWLFGTAGVTLPLLVAALVNPTLRLRYVAARDVLIDYDHAELYPDVLDLLGCVHLSRTRVQHHLRALAETFDETVAVSRSPYFFSTDISPAARPVAIDGSQELIDEGLHREAMFWIVATFARCHTILIADAPRSTRGQLAPMFEAALADLGLVSTEDLQARADEVLRFQPRLWKTTEAILSANTAIRDP